MRDRNHDPFILSNAAALRAVRDEPKTELELAIRRLSCAIGFKGRPCDDQHFLVWHPDREKYPRPAPACGACKRRLDNMLADDGRELDAIGRIEYGILAMYLKADAAAWFQWEPPRGPGRRRAEPEKQEILVKPVIGQDDSIENQNVPSGLSKGSLAEALQKLTWEERARRSPCPVCAGLGEIPGRTYGARQLHKPCPACRPSRQVSAAAWHAANGGALPCSYCGGAGQVNKACGGTIICPQCGGD